MKAEKIRTLETADLQRQVVDAQEQLFRFRFQMGMGQSEGLTKYRALKKDRARMLTVLREKSAEELEVRPVAFVAKGNAAKGNQGKAGKGGSGKKGKK